MSTITTGISYNSSGSSVDIGTIFAKFTDLYTSVFSGTVVTPAITLNGTDLSTTIGKYGPRNPYYNSTQSYITPLISYAFNGTDSGLVFGANTAISTTTTAFFTGYSDVKYLVCSGGNAGCTLTTPFLFPSISSTGGGYIVAFSFISNSTPTNGMIFDFYTSTGSRYAMSIVANNLTIYANGNSYTVSTTSVNDNVWRRVVLYTSVQGSLNITNVWINNILVMNTSTTASIANSLTSVGVTYTTYYFGASGNSTTSPNNLIGGISQFQVYTVSNISTKIDTLAPINSSVLTGTTTVNVISTKGLMYEASLSTSGTTSPFTIDYSTGGIFYIPTSTTLSANFSVIITNIPTDQTKIYTVSVTYYQSSTKFYINSARITDTASSYILGTSSTYGTPLFNGGIPSITTSPCMIIQQFNIISISSTRYITTSISNCY